jgi:hypothetical protein
VHPWVPPALHDICTRTHFRKCSGAIFTGKARHDLWVLWHELYAAKHSAVLRRVQNKIAFAGFRRSVVFGWGLICQPKIRQPHAWANRGTEPCTIMFVLVDGVTQAGKGKGLPR